MRVLIIIFLTMMACEPSSKLAVEQKVAVQDQSFRKVSNNNHTYTLHYKIVENTKSPVRNFTYFVSKYNTSEIIKKQETTAAEKIYWKDNNILAVVPYTDVARQPTEVGSTTNPNEILINIKESK